MRIHRMIITGGIVIGSLVLAGCGLTPVAAPAISHDNGSLPRTGHSSGKATSSSSSNIRPSNHKSSSSTPSTSASSTSNPSTVSPEQTVIAEAFQLIHTHTALTLSDPAKLPPAVNTSGYWTAKTTAYANRWSISLLETSHPYAINSASISANTIIGAIASWGASVETSGLSLQQDLETHNPLWSRLAVINPQASHQTTQVGTAQDGRPAILYPVGGDQWTNTRLVFTEGKWTVELIGSNAQSEEQVAYTIANDLHFQFLPPHPGLMMVELVAPSSAQSTSLTVAGTSLDWMNGTKINWVSVPDASLNNPEQAISMAVSWRPQ